MSLMRNVAPRSVLLVRYEDFALRLEDGASSLREFLGAKSCNCDKNTKIVHNLILLFLGDA